MEYIHKAKAEKTRTKVLTDQMEARRVKNKVRCASSPRPSPHPNANLRLRASVGQRVLRRSGRPLLLWSTKLPRSKYTHHDSPFICLAIDRPAACLPHCGATLFLQSRFPIYCILCHACSPTTSCPCSHAFHWISGVLQGWIVGCGWNCVRQSEAERASESLDLDLFVADAIQFMATSPGGQTRTRVSGLVCFPLSLHIPAVGFQMLWPYGGYGSCRHIPPATTLFLI